MGDGFKSLGKGIYKGATGLVSTPYQEIQKKGEKGILSGIGKGLLGLVAKPLVGVSVYIAFIINL